MAANDELARYVHQHFVRYDQFLQSANIDEGFFQDLVKARAVPGPIYRLWDNGSFWSPIGGQVGIPATDNSGTDWFSPAAIWWIRRAKVLAHFHALSMDEIATKFRVGFSEEFTQTISALQDSQYGYPTLFAEGLLDEGKCHAAGIAEWNDWIDGGYGVCLRRFDAVHLVTKTNQSARVRHLTNDGERKELSSHEVIELLNALDRLDAVMLPFAPHQRPYGTPGKWVDTVLEKYGLGSIPLIQRWSVSERLFSSERPCA